MVKTVATVVFITAAAAIALYCARRPTVARGDVIEADLRKLLEPHGVTQVVCDDAIPLGREGATFRCSVEARDGSHAVRTFKLDRGGQFSSPRP